MSTHTRPDRASRRRFADAARHCLFVLLGAAALTTAGASAQPEPPNGPRPVDPGWHALTGATAVVAPGETVENATIVLRDGVIVSVRANDAPPAGARVWDCAGLTVYAGFIDAHVVVDAPKPDAKAPGAHWNPRITPQRSALDGEGVDEATRKSLRELGFTAAAAAPKGGVLRGSAAVVSLATDAPEGSLAARAIRDPAYHVASFERAGRGDSGYPNSQMGSIALLRQTMLDSEWRAADLAAFNRAPNGRAKPAPADALDALHSQRSAKAMFVFDAEDELDILRAAKIAKEFGLRAAILGSGTEFRRLNAVVAEGLPLIVPVNYPEAPKVDSVADAESVDLRTLMSWEQAPTNARRLDASGALVALTTHNLRKRPDFAANMRSAIEHGLPKDRALAMLTTNPAKILGVEDQLGRIAPGMRANLVVVKGDVFDKDGQIRDVWIDGRRHEIKAPERVELEGEWAAVFSTEEASLDGTLKISKGNKIALTFNDKKHDARNVKLAENRLSFLIDSQEETSPGVYALSAIVEGDEMLGIGQLTDGGAVRWTAKRAPPAESTSEGAGDDAKDEQKDEKKDDNDAKNVPESFGLPFGPYALDEQPPQRHLRIVNATLWTCGPHGIVENGELEVRDGKIVYAGPARSRAPSGAETIDARGRHVTPGLIDCHSHTGISRGVNEGTQAITAEVRIGDVVNPDAIGWYRELAGGLTMANQLHGSANPIGGQNSVVKIRWGVNHPDEMRMQGAPGGIKFALGENVKQSNWGDRFTNRYPQTRMGVETIIRDAFIAAREYRAEHERYTKLSNAQRARIAPPRRDLELDALAEILEGARLVHCHSYRQDEILMLCRVARDFGFTIGTFQHVLEGYKVAEAIREVALGASAFSDWWAYKFEVFDAIPEAGAIMHEVGVTVSFNSDSDELARRMHGEAAKAVKYGGVDPQEALKFVTLNPAIQLGISDRVGSLEAGKDADFVIWSGDPLSSMSRCERTFIDGREYFSLERDLAMRGQIASERSRLIQKIRSQGAKKPSGRENAKEADAPAMVDTPPDPVDAAHARALRLRMLDLLRAGQDPDGHRCGECGVLDLDHH